MDTVLVVGASGNIGVGVTIAALRSNRNVLAVVRNKSSEDKLYQHAGTQDGITVVHADFTSENGVQEIVDRVKAGELPGFQHVFSAVGMLNTTSPITQMSTDDFRSVMNVNVESTFFTYRATAPYLISQGYSDSTWTLITGGAGEWGSLGSTAIAQGALFSFANVAIRENGRTNIRVNELFLNARVDYDDVVEKGKAGSGVLKSSELGEAYQSLLGRKDIRGARIKVFGRPDLKDLKYVKKLSDV